MNIILKICYIFIILGWTNHFYFGDCFYGGFQSLNDPKFMGTIWTTILTNKYWAKNIYYVFWSRTLVHVAKYFLHQQGIFYHITKNTTTWQGNIPGISDDVAWYIL
jgi:hypothetical protein